MALLHLSLLTTGQQLSCQTGKGRNLRAIAVGCLCFPQVSVESRQSATRAAGHNGRDLRENTTLRLSNNGSFLDGFSSVWQGPGAWRSGRVFQTRCGSFTSCVNLGKSLHFPSINFSICKQSDNTFRIKVVWK